MSDGSKRAREIAAFAAVMPSWGAVNEDNAPLNFPTGVRAAERMTTSYPECQRLFRREMKCYVYLCSCCIGPFEGFE